MRARKGRTAERNSEAEFCIGVSSKGKREGRQTMKSLTVAALFVIAVAVSGMSEPVIVNGDFEAAVINPRDPSSGHLPWSEAVPGWGHSDGADTASVYYRNSHLGCSQYFMIYD